MQSPNNINQSLRELLITYFTYDELTLLCTDLIGDAELISATQNGKETRAQQIITYLEHRGQLLSMIEWCDKERPHLRQEWQNLKSKLANSSRIHDPNPNVIVLSDDGHLIATKDLQNPYTSPLPAFDSGILETLATPGGTVKLKDTLYIQREADLKFRREVLKEGTTTIIRAPRQTGKSSLLIRGLQIAKDKDAKTLLVDFQAIGKNIFDNYDDFLKYFAEHVSRKMQLRIDINAFWKTPIPHQEKLTTLFNDEILSQINSPILLALDEVDYILGRPYAQDFFGLLRSWHNNRAYEEQWNQLNLALVISTEPYLLITDISQSPFNVGLTISLDDFSIKQVETLNQKHNSPLKNEIELNSFFNFLNGHPYLSRKALYEMVTSQQSWADFQKVANTSDGPLADHLRHYHHLLQDNSQLKKALKNIIRHNRCDDDFAFFRLLQSGLVKGSGSVCSCRCELYTSYFQNKL